MKIKLSKYARWESSALNILGMLMFFVSLLLLPSVILSVHAHESIEPFLYPMIVGLIISIFLILLVKRSSDLGPANGIFLMVVLWMGMFIFGVFPYLLSGMDLVDSIFESVSGFTTVGASVIDVTKCSKALLLWRSMTNWIGGIIIVTMFMFILPKVVSGSRRLVKSETFGARTGNFTMKLGSVAQEFIGVYISLTIIFVVVFLLCGVSLFESVNLALGAISIGGFTTTPDSIMGYSIWVKLAMIVMMTLSATNFYLHFRAVAKRDFSGYKRNDEFKIMIIWLSAMSIFVIIQMIYNGYWDKMPGDVNDRIVDVFFNIFAIGTTAGYYTLNYTEAWTFIGATLFILLMFVGGSSGSTAGGIKISRALIVIKSMINEIRQEIHPNAVYSVEYEGSGADKSAVHASIVVVMMFIITILISTVVFDTLMSWDKALYTSVALISGTGTTVGEYFTGYAAMPGWAKFFACIVMFLGRMEVLSVLAIFTIGFWKEIVGPRKLMVAKEKVMAPFISISSKVSDSIEAKVAVKSADGEQPSDASAEQKEPKKRRSSKKESEKTEGVGPMEEKHLKVPFLRKKEDKSDGSSDGSEESAPKKHFFKKKE